MFTTKLSLLALVSIIVCDVLLLSVVVQGAPIESEWNSRYQNVNKNKKDVIAYRRYVRRRPSFYPDDLYMDEFVEVFHTRQKPPAYWLSDDEVDRIIRCDFNPSLAECKQTPTTPTIKPSTVVTTTTERIDLPEVTKTTTPLAPTKMTTTTKRDIEDTTTTTERHIELTTTTNTTPTKTTTITSTTTTTTPAAISTTTEDLPFLPNISEEEYDITTTSDSILDYELVTDENINNEVDENDDVESNYYNEDINYKNNDDLNEDVEEESGL